MSDEKQVSRREAIAKIGSMSIFPFLAEPGGENLFARGGPAAAAEASQRVSLNGSVISVDGSEPSYVQYAAQDLAEYLKEITGAEVPVRASLDERAKSLIIVGKKLSQQVAAEVLEGRDLGDEGFVIRSVVKDGRTQVIAAGANPKGTNYGLANLMKMVQAEGQSAYLEGPREVQSKPRFATRGIHLNGWPFKHPYAFRAWPEKDWKQFIDIIWSQGANLFFLWPFMEIIPMPLTREDEAYLEEVRRVVDYAQKQRGMEVWIMHAANRIGTSDCGSPDPRPRAYWVNQCQLDMDPADPQQFEKVMKSLEALYRIVNNADGFGMIDSDPAGWPQSPLSDQIKIFKGARALLDKHHVRGAQAKLIDWMHIGWGRHKFFTSSESVVAQYDWGPQNPDADDVAFMVETVGAFRKGLPEPWWLIAGMAPYLRSCQKAGVLGKTIFLPYGAIEGEPSFPSTNVPLEPVRKVLDIVADYPETRGVMGNNQTSLLQLPRTYYFLASAWDFEFRKRDQRGVLLELAGHLYPEHKEFIVDCYLALEETDPQKVDAVLDRLRSLLNQGKMGRPGVIGRRLFPNNLQVARDLVFQLKIRAARQRMLKTLTSKSTRRECERLVEDYLDALLAWNKETGWEKMINIAIWRSAIYATDRRFTEVMSIIRRILAEGSNVTSYAAIASFFEPITKRLLEKYGQDAVMVGCIEPMKVAVIQAP